MAPGLLPCVGSVRLQADLKRPRGGSMQTVVIPRADWRATLDEFSTVHQGWRVSLEILDPSLGAQPEIDDLPLRGVTAEVNTRDPAITIAAGATSDQITHVIHT